MPWQRVRRQTRSKVSSKLGGHRELARTLFGVQRRIVGFVADVFGDWAALLECHHRQHVRHRPPFRPAPWVEDPAERDRRVGSTLNCPLCDRCELPDGLIVVRTTATWDECTMPDAPKSAWRVGCTVSHHPVLTAGT
jgi:hypothetical protein